MSRIYGSFSEAVGRTPLIELKRIAQARALKARLAGKLEAVNPAGSVKDRVAAAMIEAAERSGQLRPGATIIEPTSGNTGIGLAAVAASKGYPLMLVMPDTMSAERRQLMAAFGAQLVLTEGSGGMKASIARALELQAERPGSFIPGQFTNPANPEMHYRTTGPEIWEDTDGQVDVLVSGIGTGGTITGAGRYLKEKKPGLRVIAVEPADSPFLSEGRAGPHKIQGIGAGFAPEVLDQGVYDEIITVSNEDAFTAGRDMARREGLLVGVSSGAAVHAAALAAARPENAGKLIVVILPDSGDRYLSGPMFKE